MFHRSSMSAIEPLQAGVPSRASRTRPQQALLTILLIAGVVLVLCLYLLQTTKTTVKTVNIQELQLEYESLQRQNSNLLAIYAYEQSIARMTERVERAGFQPVKSVYYLPAERTGDVRVTRLDIPAPPDNASPQTETSLSMR